MQILVDALHRWDVKVCASYLLESQFMDDKSKYFAGVLSATSAMINLEVPHINVMTKMDLVGSQSVVSTGRRRNDLDRYLEPDPTLILDKVNKETNPRFHALNEAIVNLVSYINFIF